MSNYKFKIEYVLGIIVLLALLGGLYLLFSAIPSGGVNSSSTYLDDDYEEFPYREIVNPQGYVNSDPFKLSDFVGKKVILLDIMTYSCINCQRTFPYLVNWYEKYEDEGLIIIGIHTPEFSFEKKKENVEEAMREFGIKFPIVLDNDYATWNAYGNRWWPRKYLIDINGNVVYDHIGEGAYDITEKKIQDLLKERKDKLGDNVEITKSLTQFDNQTKDVRSPEVYFGAFRNSGYFGHGKIGVEGRQSFVFPENISSNKVYFDGTWDILKESVKNTKVGDGLIFKFYASELNIVASGPAKIEIYQDGKLHKTLEVNSPILYNLINNSESGEHVLMIKIIEGELELFTFTFG